MFQLEGVAQRHDPMGQLAVAAFARGSKSPMNLAPLSPGNLPALLARFDAPTYVVVVWVVGPALAIQLSLQPPQGTPLVELSLETFSLGIADALQTQFLTSTAAARHMQKRGSGVILAITATPARVLLPNQGNFGVACAAIERLCQQLACELGPQGIRVICLRSAGSPDAPGVKWAIGVLAEQAGVSPEAFEASLGERTLLKRMPKLSEVAEMAVLMASDRASAMTGAVANVTCGETVD